MDRKELKRRARTAFRANLVVCMLAGLLVAFLVEASSSMDTGTALTYLNEAMSGAADYSVAEVVIFYVFKSIVMFLNGLLPGAIGMFVYNLLFGLGFLGLAVVLFLSNIVEVGVCNFFLVNSSRKAYVNELFFPFQNRRYGRILAVQMYRLCYTIGWGMLLIVPGIIKSFNYRMIPYILVDYPELKMEEAFAKSKEMIEGHRKELFLLDLSFIGWDLLGACTLGLTSTFYSNPYKYAARAEFYLNLRGPLSSSSAGAGTGFKPSRKGDDAFASYNAYQRKLKGEQKK